MDVKIEPGWKAVLSSEFKQPYFQELSQFVRTEYKTKRCFPPGSLVFSAFDHTPFKEVKVVVIGQDPYHGPGQANGLCFSVGDAVPKPPSLQNIFEEIKTDLGLPVPPSGNLERWADQGVLLLNATLTVRAHSAGSHQNKGWEQFTDAAIQALSEQRDSLVFMLWGGYAKKKGAKINSSKHLVLSTGHPSPLSANRGYWFGNKHFSKANNYLAANDKDIINW